MKVKVSLKTGHNSSKQVKVCGNKINLSPNIAQTLRTSKEENLKLGMPLDKHKES